LQLFAEVCYVNAADVKDQTSDRTRF